MTDPLLVAYSVLREDDGRACTVELSPGLIRVVEDPDDGGLDGRARETLGQLVEYAVQESALVRWADVRARAWARAWEPELGRHV